MVPVQAGLARPIASTTRIFAATSGASAPRRSARSISRRAAATYRSTTSGRVRPERREVGLERPDVAAGHRAGQRGPDPERPGVAERPLDERPVDGERAGLVEPGHPAELGDGVEERHEAAGGQDRGRVIGGLRPRREPDGRRADRPRPCRPASRPAGRRPRSRRSRRGARRRPARVSAKATSGWNEPIWVPAAIAGGEDLGPERAAGVDHRLAAVHPERGGQRADDVVRHGQDDQLDLVEDRLRVGEDAGARRPASGTARAGPASRLATAWIGQPARVRATASAVPTAPAPTIPMIGGSPGPRGGAGGRGRSGAARSSWRCEPGGADRGRCRPPRWRPVSPRGRARDRRRAGRPMPSSGSSAADLDRRRHAECSGRPGTPGQALYRATSTRGGRTRPAPTDPRTARR